MKNIDNFMEFPFTTILIKFIIEFINSFVLGSTPLLIFFIIFYILLWYFTHYTMFYIGFTYYNKNTKPLKKYQLQIFYYSLIIYIFLTLNIIKILIWNYTNWILLVCTIGMSIDFWIPMLPIFILSIYFGLLFLIFYNIYTQYHEKDDVENKSHLFHYSPFVFFNSKLMFLNKFIIISYIFVIFVILSISIIIGECLITDIIMKFADYFILLSTYRKIIDIIIYIIIIKLIIIICYFNISMLMVSVIVLAVLSFLSIITSVTTEFVFKVCILIVIYITIYPFVRYYKSENYWYESSDQWKHWSLGSLLIFGFLYFPEEVTFIVMFCMMFFHIMNLLFYLSKFNKNEFISTWGDVFICVLVISLIVSPVLTNKITIHLITLFIFHIWIDEYFNESTINRKRLIFMLGTMSYYIFFLDLKLAIILNIIFIIFYLCCNKYNDEIKLLFIIIVLMNILSLIHIILIVKYYDITVFMILEGTINDQMIFMLSPETCNDLYNLKVLKYNMIT